MIYVGMIRSLSVVTSVLRVRIVETQAYFLHYMHKMHFRLHNLCLSVLTALIRKIFQNL